jgi:succinoglycan biosynthesis transport protein ExoP
MELSYYLAPLRKWWWLLVASAVLAAVSSYFVVSRQPPVYQATATLLIGRAFENPNISGGELTVGQQLAQTYADIARRQPVREGAMAALDLEWLPDYIARPVPYSQLLEIVVSDTDPGRAQAVADELANQLILQSPTAPRPEEQERNTFVNDQLARLQTSIGETEAEIVDKQSQLEQAFSAREIADLESQIAALQNKLGTLQSNYANLLNNTQSGAVNTLTLIEPASLPHEPVGPARLQTVLTASVIALALAAGTAFLLEYLDDTIKSSEDIKRITGLLALPSVPEIEADGNPHMLVALDQPRAPATEAFRALRASIQFKYRDEPGNVLLVTSARPGEGKSNISANLAIVLAQAGHRVLLIDADLRRPMQHKSFGLSNHEGLVELLLKYSPNGKSPDEKAILRQAVQPSAQERLDVLVSGAMIPEGPQLLSLEIMEDLLASAVSQYDYVLVDSPPLLAAADAVVLSTRVNGVLLLVQTGATRRKELKQAVEQLTDVDANIVGIVLNRMKVSSEGYYYRYNKYYDSKAPAQTSQESKLIHENGTKREQSGEPQAAD